MVGYKQALQRTGGKKAKSRGWINANTQYNEFRDNADFKHKREKKKAKKMAKKKRRAAMHAVFAIKGDDFTESEKNEVLKALNSHQWNATKARASQLGYHFF